MIRTTLAAGVIAAALGFSSTANAQGFSLSIGTGPRYGYGSGYSNYAPGWYGGGGFYDQRYYGDWRDYRGHYRRPHYHYHAYPFPHYDLHYGRHGHGHRHHHHHDHGHHRHHH